MKIVTAAKTSTTMKGLLCSTIISLILLSSLLTVQATDAIDKLVNELLSSDSAGITDTEATDNWSSSSTVSSSSSNSRAAFDVFATTTLLAKAADTDTSNTVNFNKAAWERVKSLQCFFLQKDAGLCTGSIDADGYTILCSYCTLTKEGMDDAGLKSSDDVEQVCVPSFSKDMLIDEHKVTECVDADPTTDEEHDEWLKKKQEKEDKEKKEKKEKEEKEKEKKKKADGDGDDDDYVVIQTDDKYNDDNAVFRHYKKMMAHDDDDVKSNDDQSRDDDEDDDKHNELPSKSKKNTGVRGRSSRGSRQRSAMLWMSNRPLMKLAWPRLFG